MASQPSTSALLFFNGINGATGEYGLPPMTGQDLARFVQAQAAPENLAELRFRFRNATLAHFGLKEGLDPKKLSDAGWGVIFPSDTASEIKDALRPLLDLRKQQAGDRFRIYEGGDGFRIGTDNKNSFLARHRAGPGPADPDRVPYYLLIAGGPEKIPYRFQSQLDVQYAVGRVHFDHAEEYARYAESVVAAEGGRVRRARKLAFFGVENSDDRATISSTRQLAKPLFEKFANAATWQASAVFGPEANKARLAQLLGGSETPALLFTASHGMEFPLGDPRQFPHQGALLCGDWPGPKQWRNPIPQDHYFAADDLAADLSLLGLISFHFACYGAGTPELDEFAQQAFKERRAIAPRPFIAGLPARMLSHPRGGALAVVGHVERAWSYSFEWPGAGAQTTVFESTLQRLLDGHPIGSALEFFNERYAELSTVLSDELEEAGFGKLIDPYELAGMWTANNDARGYTLIGDPAVRLSVADAGETPVERPVIIADQTGFGGEAAAPTSFSVNAGVDASSFAVSADEANSEVLFSAWHPRALRPAEWQPLLVYAHLEAALDGIKADAGQVLGKAIREFRQSGAVKATAKIAAETEIVFVPQGSGLEFEPASQTLKWGGDWRRADFKMRATAERTGHVVEGSVSCYVGPLLIADIRVPVVVLEPGQTAGPDEGAPEVTSAKMYQAVFASYSHSDTVVVEAVETAYKALGMDYLRDVMTLRSGQKWSNELLSMIDRADIFQLFWSASSSQSPYVEQEWQHALQLIGKKGPAFVRPVYWEKPMPAVPGALSSIHFAPVDFGRFTPKPADSAVRALTAMEEDLKTVSVSTFGPGGALAARTKVVLNGETETHVAGVDPALMDVHTRIVREAVAARLAYLKWLAKSAGQ